MCDSEISSAAISLRQQNTEDIFFKPGLRKFSRMAQDIAAAKK